MFSQELQADWDNAKPRIEKGKSIMASQKPVALVTGASSGIGQATAERLSAHGFNVFGTSRTPREDTRSYTWLPLDVRSEDSVQAAIQSLLAAQAERIDLLVNNAGYVQFGAIEESSVADAQAQLDTNLLGVIRMVKAVLPVMRKLGSGRIINISSIVGQVAAPYGGLYATSKFAACGAERGPARRGPPVRSERLAR
jgi:NAD(P)-dependent dehydrogenase (short-subunit alcohol dehydrogenase family)